MMWKTKKEDARGQTKTAYGFLYLNGAATRGIGWGEETSPTIMAWGGIAVMIKEGHENGRCDRS
jgi:hypothetical protein